MSKQPKYRKAEVVMRGRLSRWNCKLYTAADLFWMRYHLGCIYLNNNYPEESERLKRSKYFWDWFRKIWHYNDLYYLKHSNNYQEHKYRFFQRERFEDYKPTLPLLEAALRETEVATV